MIKPEPAKPTPLPVLLVYGKPTGAGLPQAAWFRVEDRATVAAAAQNMKYAIAEIKSEAEQSLLKGVYEGVLKGSGRMVIGSVSVEAYRCIEQHASQTAKTASASPASDEKASGENGKEQNMNLPREPAMARPALPPTSAGAPGDKARSGATFAPTVAATPSDPWRDLRVGSHVLAKFWETNGDPNGWWVAVVTDVGSNGLVARWLDEPMKPGFKIDAKHIGLLHPAFDPTREWERKR